MKLKIKGIINSTRTKKQILTTMLKTSGVILSLLDLLRQKSKNKNQQNLIPLMIGAISQPKQTK